MSTCSKCDALVLESDRRVFGSDLDLCPMHLSWRQQTAQASQEDKTAGINFRQGHWPELCPEQYRLNDITQIEKGKFEDVQKWRLGPQGLLCMGASQTGKTTSCWRLLETLYIVHGVQFEAISETRFSGKLSRHGIDFSASQWLEKLCRAHLLFLDDIGHSATTPRHLEDLYNIVEVRTGWRRPIICTTQFTPNELLESAAHGGKKTVVAILNRLRRACRIVQF